LGNRGNRGEGGHGGGFRKLAPPGSARLFVVGESGFSGGDLFDRIAIHPGVLEAVAGGIIQEIPVVSEK
jgi:hypothetical protein